MRFRIVDDDCVVLEGEDGTELLRSPPLASKLACRARILAIRLNAVLDEMYARADVAPFGVAFALHAADGSLLAVSPVFLTPEARERAIESVRHGAVDAYVVHGRDSDDSWLPPIGLRDAEVTDQDDDLVDE